jgi:hypothetical protein
LKASALSSVIDKSENSSYNFVGSHIENVDSKQLKDNYTALNLQNSQNNQN